MKKKFLFILVFILLFGLMAGTALAVDNSQKYNFAVTANDVATANVAVGDEVTVKVILKSGVSPFQVYALQDELLYDSTCLELIEDSGIVADDFRFSTRNMSDGISQKVIISFLSPAINGKTMESGLIIGSCKFKVLKSGAHIIQSVNYKMSTANGMDTFDCTSNDVVIKTDDGSESGSESGPVSGSEGGSEGAPSGSGGAVTEEYKVMFYDGSNLLAEKVVVAGIAVAKPADPVKSGYAFTGWFTDKECTKAYDFSQKVNGNLNLYAGWRSASQTAFTDVNGHWAENAVNFVVEQNLFNGTSETTFSPNANMTRAMLVTVLWRLDGKPQPATAPVFKDVAEGAYYADAVAWANANGIIKGYSNTEFAPNDNITREQMAAILYRYAEFKGYATAERADLKGYSDYNKISGYALDNLSWANAVGLINGRTQSTLVPQGNATRAEVAAILQRFVDNVVK